MFSKGDSVIIKDSICGGGCFITSSCKGLVGIISNVLASERDYIVEIDRKGEKRECVFPENNLMIVSKDDVLKVEDEVEIIGTHCGDEIPCGVTYEKLQLNDCKHLHGHVKDINHDATYPYLITILDENDKDMTECAFNINEIKLVYGKDKLIKCITTFISEHDIFYSDI
jgi:hypothetical protein